MYRNFFLPFLRNQLKNSQAIILKLSLYIIFIFMLSLNLSAITGGYEKKYHGLGLGIDLNRGINEEKRFIPDLYLTYRNGSLDLLSGFFYTDIGYRFKESSLSNKIGTQVMILLFGIELGYIQLKSMENEKYSPGIFFGWTFMVPQYSQNNLSKNGFFISLGVNLFLDHHENEIYFSLNFFHSFWN